MRVIEPHQLKSVNKEEKKSKRTLLVLILLLAISLGGVYWTKYRKESSLSKTTNTQIKTTPDKAATNKPDNRPLKEFTGAEFKAIYEETAYPNTMPITTPPAITGNYLADQRIRQFAEERGYKPTFVPIQAIIKINEPRLIGDDLLQPLAAKGWQSLKAAAKAENVPLSMNAAYRSVDYQRDLFLQRLYANNTNAIQISQGAGNAAIITTLGLTAVPGYSRHHTGYTVDLWCEDGSVVFAFSSCFRWLSVDNYKHAKENGWIPSYPEGAGQQGPEPEPWEYVWVGTDRLK